MKFILAAIVASAAARQTELVSIGEKMAQLKHNKGNLEGGVVRSIIGEKDGFDVHAGEMKLHTDMATYTEDSPAGYKEHMTVQIPIGEALLMIGAGDEINNHPFNGPYTNEINEEEPWKSRVENVREEALDDFKEMVDSNSNELEYKEANANPGIGGVGHEFDMPKPDYADAVGFSNAD